MPYKDQHKQREAWRRYAAKHRLSAKKNGHCTNCYRPAMNGISKCQVCNDHKLNYSKRVKSKVVAKRVSEGRCPECGRPMLGDTYYRCMVCRENKTKSEAKLWS